MTNCAICEEEVEEVTKCRMCGETFCAECGSADVKLCTYCLEDDLNHDDDDDVHPDENWYEKQQLVERFYELDPF